jgi:NAD(P)-dependent dehydrogenase (short-subunit alcohol dehydrogenase family)
MDAPFSSAYNVSKAGLIRFVGCVQREVENTDIQLFAVHPGEVGGTQLGDVNYVTKDYVRQEAPEVPEHVGPLLRKILDCHTRLPAWTSVFLASGKVNSSPTFLMSRPKRFVGSILMLLKINRRLSIGLTRLRRKKCM